MDLQEMRDAVRNQMDVDDSELSNPVLDLFLLEAYQQTIALEERWPFFETDWQIPVLEGVGSTTLPPDVESIGSIKAVTTSSRMLKHTPQQFAEADYVTGGTGYVQFYSVWAGNLYLWPVPDEDVALTIRGRRLASDWTVSAANECDADSRLHLPIVHYAVSRVYAQQEDDQLAQFYLQTWNASTLNARKAIMANTYQGVWQMAQGGS
jgi:hypothetical protein